jgi:hypothetical protein
LKGRWWWWLKGEEIIVVVVRLREIVRLREGVVGGEMVSRRRRGGEVECR